MNTYTPAELAQKNGVEGSEVWIAYNGLIYDVSASKLFANGKHFRHHAGQDLTHELPNAPHTDRVFSNFPVVGRLVEESGG